MSSHAEALAPQDSSMERQTVKCGGEDVLMTNILADENSVSVVNEIIRILEAMSLNEIGEK